MIKGRIPNEIKIFYRDEITLAYRKWDDLDSEEELKVTPVFVCDVERKSFDVPYDWAAAPVWINKDEGYTARKSREDIKVDTLSNEPFSGLKIHSLQHRGNGGRAWKVIDKEGRYFDLREDCLLYALKNFGVKVGGEINGKFVWAVTGNNMKLIPVGSELHQSMVKGKKRTDIKKIPNSDLVVGGVYQSLSGKTAVYLGEAKSYWEVNVRVGQDGMWSYNYNPDSIIISRQLIRQKRMIWMEWYSESEDHQADFDKDLCSEWPGLELKSSHSYIDKIGQVNVPPDFLEIAKKSRVEKWDSHYSHSNATQAFRDAQKMREFCSEWFNCSMTDSTEWYKEFWDPFVAKYRFQENRAPKKRKKRW